MLRRFPVGAPQGANAAGKAAHAPGTSAQCLTALLQAGIRRPALEQAAQHPRGLLMHLHALGQQVERGLVARLVGDRSDAACGLDDRFLALHQQADHLLRARHAFRLGHAGELLEFLVGAGRRETERADAFGDLVHRERELVVLRLEHQMQGVEHRPRHVPVEVVRGEVQGVAVREQARQAFSDLGAVLFLDADIDFHAGSPVYGRLHAARRGMRFMSAPEGYIDQTDCPDGSDK